MSLPVTIEGVPTHAARPLALSRRADRRAQLPARWCTAAFGEVLP